MASPGVDHEVRGADGRRRAVRASGWRSPSSRGRPCAPCARRTGRWRAGRPRSARCGGSATPRRRTGALARPPGSVASSASRSCGAATSSPSLPANSDRPRWTASAESMPPMKPAKLAATNASSTTGQRRLSGWRAPTSASARSAASRADRLGSSPPGRAPARRRARSSGRRPRPRTPTSRPTPSSPRTPRRSRGCSRSRPARASRRRRSARPASRPRARAPRGRPPSRARSCARWSSPRSRRECRPSTGVVAEGVRQPAVLVGVGGRRTRVRRSRPARATPASDRSVPYA